MTAQQLHIIGDPLYKLDVNRNQSSKRTTSTEVYYLLAMKTCWLCICMLLWRQIVNGASVLSILISVFKFSISIYSLLLEYLQIGPC